MNFAPSSPLASPLIAASASFFSTLALTPLVLSLSVRLRLFDPPGPLKIHSRPTPRTGGIALGLGLLTGILLVPQARAALGADVLIAFAILWLAGILDDLRGLSVALRLVAQIIAAALLWLGGYRLPVAELTLGLLASIFFCLVAFNAFNFLDGSDGLASSGALVIAAGFASAYLFKSPDALPGLTIAATLAGACAAFLIFNFPPARIFLGDSGSTLLGFLFALLAMKFVSPGTAEYHSPSVFFFPFFAAMLPFLDFFFAIFRRLPRGESPLSGDRGHYYDLLLRRGWTPRSVAIASALVTAGLCCIGLLALLLNGKAAAGIFAACLLGLSVCGVRLGIARSDEKGQLPLQ